MNFYLIIPASGIGKRFGGKKPKQFLNINGESILINVIRKFHSTKKISGIFISTLPEYIADVTRECEKKKLVKVKSVTAGGKSRQESVFKSLINVKARRGDKIIIHDAVRPFVTTEFIKKIIISSEKNKNVIPGIRITDTVKRTDKLSFVSETISRENLWQVQTPQIFEYSELMKAFEYAKEKKYTGTDESSIMEFAGFKVKIFEGEYGNKKITLRKDYRNFL